MKELASDLKNVIYWSELFAPAGNLVWKTATKRAALVLAIGYALAVGDERVLKEDVMDPHHAFGMGLLTLAGFLTVGAAAKYLPAIWTKHHSRVAQASSIKLLEDKKKSRALEHLATLWDRVYKYEAKLEQGTGLYEKAQIIEATGIPEMHLKGLAKEFSLEDMLHACGPIFKEIRGHKLVGEPIPYNKSDLGFLVRALTGINSPMPAPIQRHLVGLELDKYLQWLDYGTFESAEGDVANFFRASNKLKEVSKQAKHRGMKDKWNLYWQGWWRKRLGKGLYIRVGEAVSALNKKFDTHYVDTHHFLWPSKTQDKLLEELAGEEVAIAVREERREVITKVFGDPIQARRIVDRAFSANVSYATHLRSEYDPEYILAETNHTPESDTPRTEMPNWIGKMRKKAAKRQEAFDRFLDEKLADESFDARQLRAMRIAYHTDQRGILRALNLRRYNADRVKTVLMSAAEKHERYTSNLLRLRLQQALAIIEYKDAQREAKELLGYVTQET